MSSSAFSRRSSSVAVETLEGRQLMSVSPTHVYELNGNLKDSLGGPSLISGGGSLSSTGYTFGTKQGLTLSNGVNSGTYSIEMVFKLSNVSGYRKLIDFKNYGQDAGLYDNGGSLVFYSANTPTVTGVFAANKTVQLVITRDAATKKTCIYIDGAKKLDFTDTGSVATFSSANAVAHFFQDDSGEHPTGFVDRIRTFNTALTQAQVTELKTGTATIALGTDGKLTLTGTTGSDNITVTATSTSYTAKVNGLTKTFSKSAVKSIAIDGSDGDDIIAINSSVFLASTIKGGIGNDNISGGSGNDVIDGGAGNDNLAGNVGNDTLTAGTGQDVLSGGAGNDILYAKNSTKSSLDGGSGTDKAQRDAIDSVLNIESFI